MDNAFMYIEAGHPLETETEYPYTAKDGKTCKVVAGEGKAAISSHKDVKRDDAS